MNQTSDNEQTVRWRDYIGIPFTNHGRDLDGVDCWGLVTIVYRRELQIVLPDYHERYRDAEHIRGIARAFQDHTGDDFSQVSLLDAEPTDCVVVEIRGLPIHVGVYVGDIDGRRSMLHTMEARGHSMIEPIFSPLKLWLSSNWLLEASQPHQRPRAGLTMPSIMTTRKLPNVQPARTCRGQNRGAAGR